MAPLLYRDASLAVELGAHGAHIARELRLGKAKIDLAQGHKILEYVVRGGLYHLGQLGEDPFDLGGFLHDELLVLVAELHHGGGLYEQRRAGAGLIVYEPGDVLTVLLFYGYYEAPVPYRYERILQIFRVSLRMDHVVELLPHLLVRKLHLPAYARKRGRSAVEYLVLAQYAAIYLVLDRAVRHKPARHIAEARDLALVRAVDGALGCGGRQHIAAEADRLEAFRYG